MSFVILDGPNGAGKTTVINNLKAKGTDTLSSPNGTPLAQFLRPVCRGTEPWVGVDKTVQFLAFSAARLDEYINRVHGKNHLIVSDRWWTSTFVYQCVLQGLDEKFLEYTVHPKEKIDLVIIMYGDSDVLIDRVIKEREKNPAHGVCTWTKERETMKRINEIYQIELPKYLDRRNIKWVKTDTTQYTIEEIQAKVEQLIMTVQK
jgi:thymidylate kinase